MLGTSFNVNSYEDEESIKTTLLEGSVKVNAPKSSVVLKPGQQAQVSSRVEIVNADIDQTIAWKNGVFNFNGLGVRAVMAQLARWYDINVRYEGTIPSNIFRGEMYRSVKLSSVLDFLKRMGVEFRMEGKTIIIM